MKKPGSIPVAPLLPVLRRYLREYQALVGAKPGAIEDRSHADFGGQNGLTGWDAVPRDGVRFVNALDVLAAEAGMKSDTLRRYVDGMRTYIDPDIAERLALAMGRPDVLHVEMADHYMPLAA